MKLFSKFGNLRVWQKLTLVAVTMAMPVFLLAYLLISTLTEQAGSIRAELQGLDYLQAFRQLESGLATRDAALISTAVQHVDDLVAGKGGLLDAGDSKWTSLKAGAKELRAEEAAKLSILARELSGDIAAKANLVSDDTMIPRLQAELDRKLQAKDRGTSLALFAIAIGALLALWLVYRLANGISRQTQSIEETFARIGQGDYQARAAVVTSDELGQMAFSMNAVLDNTLALVQSRQERDQIQNAVMKLLEDVSGVADGDLTKEAEVTADMTGAIADSFNHMIAQLRRIIGNVQNTSRQVYRSANEVFSTAQGLATGSENQAMQIVNTSNAVDEMAGSIRQVSENAAVSAQVAQQALNNARQGNDAVKNTIAGMDRIRNQVQETAKRIKRLGESTQEIGQIIQLIDDIADRTSILALNASIQAAAAGEAGRGFAVVAEEVERLADRSTDATKKIATLVKTIQSETNEAVGAMEKGINEVVEGSRLAASAGQALGEIESVSNKLADLISTISLASKQQARASEGVAKSMNEIEEITQATATGTKQAAGAVNSLAQLAESLRQSVAMFRMPGGHQTADGTSMVIGKGTMAKIEFAAAVGPAKEAVATRF